MATGVSYEERATFFRLDPKYFVLSLRKILQDKNLKFINHEEGKKSNINFDQ